MKKGMQMIAVILLAGLGVWQIGSHFFMQINALSGRRKVQTKEGYERLLKMETKQQADVKTLTAKGGQNGAGHVKAVTGAAVKDHGETKKKYVKWKKHPLTIKEAKKTFENCVILGDSVVEAMDVYGILYANELVYNRGKSVGQADDMVKAVIKLMPEKVFIVFGINDLEYYRGDAKRFAKEYKIQIKKIQKALPDCEIYVNAINPVQKYAITKENQFEKIDKFNTALKKMCDEDKLAYIDSSPIIKGHKDLYEPDGVHPTYSYYPKWLALLAEVAGIDS